MYCGDDDFVYFLFNFVKFQFIQFYLIHARNAKELIADVIRRNASPVRTEGIGHQMRADSSSSVSSSGLDDNLVSGHRSKTRFSLLFF